MSHIETPTQHHRSSAPSGADGAASTTRLVRTLTVTVALQWLGATAIVPMLPVYIRHLGGSDALAGLVMAAFFAAGVLTQYPMGRLADRIGRRPVLVGGLLVYAGASLAFLAPVGPVAAVGLRALQGLGAGAATVASLAAIASSVTVERRGRAFAAVYGGEIAGMAVGPLVGSIAGVAHMRAMFVVSGVVSAAACIPARRVVEPLGPQSEGRSRRSPLARLRLRRPAVGALVTGATLGLAAGVYDICWTLLLLSRGASGWEVGVSWTLFAVPFLIAAGPSGWLADHIDRRVLVVAGVGVSAGFCAAYPFLASVPLLVVLGALEALGFAACLPAVQSLLTEGTTIEEAGRVQGLFATCQTASTAVAAAGAGAAFAVAHWLPFVAVAGLVGAALVAVVIIWLPVPGRVTRPDEPWSETVTAPLPVWSESIQVAAPEVGSSIEVQ
ncbi:MAG: MFS transporter [Acidimicrobiales bacterium]|nr:MFS transporter [Acidimicrobiales bacterium]